MKRILIFGTGGGAGHYLKYLNSDYNLLGFLDNDVQKHGSLFFDKPVYAPEAVLTIPYDEIHVASQWVLDIKKQLMQHYLIPEERIFAVSRANLMSCSVFDNGAAQKLAKEFIHEICLFAKTLNIPIYLSEGSLLGIMRDKELIRWDYDIDFVLEDKYLAPFIEQLPHFFSASPVNQYFTFNIERRSKDLAVWLQPKEALNAEFVEPIQVCFTIAYMQEEYAMTELDRYYIPKHFFSPLKWVELHPGQASTFSNPDEYLTLLYGDWHKVRKNFQYSEYGNIVGDAGFSLNQYIMIGDL